MCNLLVLFILKQIFDTQNVLSDTFTRVNDITGWGVCHRRIRPNISVCVAAFPLISPVFSGLKKVLNRSLHPEQKVPQHRSVYTCLFFYFCSWQGIDHLITNNHFWFQVLNQRHNSTSSKGMKASLSKCICSSLSRSFDVNSSFCS